ncbi:lipase family protein [Pontibacter rufus]|uniref:lipase family protein n=1 Tax=Pontibacter rufus TaxID=2791028 RepID=UPI001E621D77|nr:lipase family protein [Pontibacter sp. 172403-2]
MGVEIAQDKEHLVSSELVASVPQSMLRSIAASEGFGAYSNEIKYGVDVYKIVYYTTYQDREIKASGLVCVPQGISEPAPVLSAQHGTIFNQQEAPTNFTDLSGFELFASSGYVTFIPDYIGFGESAGIFHPYYNQKYSGLAVVDMIKAGKSFCRKENIPLSDKLFLVGYSEGGYVTLAAQKEIETHPEHGLQVTASAAGAGGYDLVSMLGGVTAGKPYPYPSYLAYVLQSYNNTSNWNRPLTDFFQEPYASRLPNLFDGTNGGSAINRQLTTDPKTLFSPGFFEALQKPAGELPLKQALQANSFYDWVPQSPTRLYHGTADEIVPFENSKQTYERFAAQGAMQLKFIPIPEGTHGTAFEPMLRSVIPWIQSF